MNHDPKDLPLTPEEIELARVVHALPAGEPSDALDARILATARDALEAGSQPLHEKGRFSHRGAVGLAVAASAVLAISLALRLQPWQAPMPAGASIVPPSSQPAAPPPLAPAFVNDAPSVTMERLAGASAIADATSDNPMPLPAGDAVTASSAVKPAIATRQPELPPLPSPAPPSPPPPPPPPSPPTLPTLNGSLPATATLSEQATAMPAHASAMHLEDLATTERRRASTAERLVPAQEASTSAEAWLWVEVPIADDARLAPAAWLERIRQRLAQDDLIGARESLRAFALRHPEYPLPDDLRRADGP